MRFKKIIFSCFSLLFFSGDVWAQEISHGIVLDHNNKPVNRCEIRLSDEILVGTTNESGKFTCIKLIDNGATVFGYVNGEKILGYRWKNQLPMDTLIVGEGLDYMGDVTINIYRGSAFSDEIRAARLQLNPTTGSGVESLVKTMIGVSSNNELSSSYSVRGGNYDENLVYVNDIEILRPQLISNGQQEGLSFINSDLVNTVNFSAGGFGAEYGDKMSSVLDVQYLKPDSQSVIANLGTMINSFGYLNGNKKMNGGVSFRHFSNSLLTRSLNVSGDYSMQFMDAQAFLNVKLNSHWKLELLGNIARNEYNLNPISRTTTFGTIQSALQLDVGMAGQESLNYLYGMGAATLIYRPNLNQEFKWIVAQTQIQEQEYFDVQGAYSLSELDRDLGSDNFGKKLRTLGYGYYIDHGRNRLNSTVTQVAHLGTLGKLGSKFWVKYGIRAHQESIKDRMLEWYYNDSADYNVSLMGYLADSIILDDYILAKNQLNGYRFKNYVSATWRLSKTQQIWLNAGIRNQYWTVNQEWLWMPRLTVTWEPNKWYNQHVRHDSLKRPSIQYKFAVGAYHQPGFYSELRGFDGTLNRSLLAQKSWHALLGLERYLLIREQRFKYTAEAYGKYLYDLVPYLFDNIRIRYYAQNSAHGYAWGLDQRIYGEFTKGLESWFTLGVMQTREKITYSNTQGEMVESEWLRRPTDRRVNFSAVFQDQLKNNPSVRVNLSLFIGTSIPYYFDGMLRYQTKPNVITPYRRIDLGFSKTFSANKYTWMKKHGIAEAWISVDLFNVLDINNVISYSWIKDLNNNRYGVPDYLTGRRLNLRLHMRI